MLFLVLVASTFLFVTSQGQEVLEMCSSMVCSVLPGALLSKSAH